MIFATILYLCTSATSCDSYVVDTANTMEDCMINLVAHSETTANVWGGAEGMNWWLKENGISGVDVSKLVDYDYVCEKK